MDDDQDVSGLVHLARTPLPERRALLTSALSLPTLDPLAAVSTLRRKYPDLDPSVCSALVTQQQLLLAGADKGLIDATGLWMTTPVGLEQASRPQVAFRRASLLAAAGVRSVVDATAGIGMDSHAFARRGMHVIAVEKDPVTSEVCAANLTATLSEVDAPASVINADATEPDLLGFLPSSCLLPLPFLPTPHDGEAPDLSTGPALALNGTQNAGLLHGPSLFHFARTSTSLRRKPRALSSPPRRGHASGSA